MTAVASTTFSWAWQALLVSLTLGLVFSACVGVALLLRPGAMMRLHHRWSRWVDTNAWFAHLDRMLWNLEPRIYRHHRIAGTLLAAAAAYVLWQWAFAYDREHALRVLAPRLQGLGLDWLAIGLEWVVVLVHAGALLLGAVIVVRPSLLKGLERAANQWHKHGDWVEALDRPRDVADRWFALHPRLLGLIVLCASAFSLVALSVPLRLALG